jgi:hypothetical protein
MSSLIAENSNYLRMLRMHPKVTIYESIADYDRYDAVASVMRNRGYFIKRQPAYLASIMNRMEVNYEQYSKHERPAIKNLSGYQAPSVHSAAGPKEIEILRHYRRVQSSLAKLRPKISVSA